MLTRIIFALIVFFAAPFPTPICGKEALFDLHAEVVTALEGGPIIIRTRLIYQGKHPLNVFPLDNAPFSPTIEPPQTWKRNDRIRLSTHFGGIVSPEAQISPRTTWRSIHYLHRDYNHIPQGTHYITVEKRIHKPGAWSADGKRLTVGPLLALPSVKLKLVVLSPSGNRVKKVAAELLSTARESSDDPPRRQLAETLLDTRHEEFILAGVELIKKGDQPYSNDLLEWMYTISKNPDSVNRLLTDVILNENPASAEVVYSFWQSLRYQASSEYFHQWVFPPSTMDLQSFGFELLLRPHGLGLMSPYVEWRLKRKQAHFNMYVRAAAFRIPEQEWKKLIGATSVWTQALTYATFPERGERDWTSNLLTDLQRLANPISDEVLKPLLKQLDHRQFPVRERATQQLIRRGDAATAALRAVLDTELSAEVRQRVKRILDEHAKQAENPPHRRLLPLLVGRGGPEGRAMLEALAKGSPQLQLTKDARKLLDEMKPSPR